MKKLLLLLIAALLLTTYLGAPAITQVSALSLTAPHGLSAEVFQNYIHLTWNNSNEDFYSTVIEKSTDQGNFNPIATLYKGITVYKDYSVSNGHVYTYRTRTIYGSSSSVYTSDVEAITFYPDSFTITHVTSNQVDMEWTYPTLPLLRTPNYKTVIERRLINTSTWTILATLPAIETTYSDTTAVSDSIYYYRIRTQYTNGSYSYYIPSDWGLYTRTPYPLTTSLWGYAISDTQIKLEWDMTQANGGKAVLQKKDAAGNFYSLSTSEYYNSTVDTYLTKGKTYTYRLMLQSKNGMNSEFTEEVSIITELVPSPSDSSGSALSADRIALSWNYPYDVETGFEIWRNDSGSWKHVGTVPKNTETFTDNSVQGGKIYTYRVRAMRGETAFSPFSLPQTVNNTFPETPGELVYLANRGLLHLYSIKDVPANTIYTLEYREGINSEWKDFKSCSQGTLIALVAFSSENEWYFRLRANIGQLASYSPEFHFFGSVPDPVQSFEAAITGFDRVLLTWKNSGYKQEVYKIYRTANGNRQLLGRVTHNIERYTDNTPLKGAISKYEIVAYNATGQSESRFFTVTIPKLLTFKDIAPYKWASDAIYTLLGLGAIDYDNGYFEPEKALSRGQMTRLVLRSFNIPYESQGLFTLTDLSPNHGYYKDMMTAINLGMIHPDAQGKIYPDKSATRRDLALLLNNTLNSLGIPLSAYLTDNLQSYDDYAKVSSDEAHIIASFVGDGLITGKTGRLLGLSDNASKVEGVAIIYRTLRRYKPYLQKND